MITRTFRSDSCPTSLRVLSFGETEKVKFRNAEETNKVKLRNLKFLGIARNLNVTLLVEASKSAAHRDKSREWNGHPSSIAREC